MPTDETKKVATPKEEPDYKKLYLDSSAKAQALENKVTELEKLCESYAQREKQVTQALQQATLEYNARTQYMLDCVKHAHISMQFALAAGNEKK